MSEVQIKRWEKVRAKGKRSFLISYTLGMGLFWVIGKAVIKYFRHPDDLDWLTVVLSIPFGLLYGFLMSKFFWWWMEEKYSQLIDRRQ